MPLNKKYNPSDIRTLLNIYANKKSILKPSEEHIILGGAMSQSPYQDNKTKAVILDPVTDNNEYLHLPTIKNAVETLNPNLKNNAIIMPVAEKQKIFGLFSRDHWVTLHYNPKENRATIIDSRPWYVSMFYPTSGMKQSLQDGIKTLYGEDGEEKARTLSFKSLYQGVQHNDTHCGAWTTRNMLDLAAGHTVEKQHHHYSANQEVDVANNLILDYNNNKDSKEHIVLDVPTKKPTFLQRVLAFFGLATKPPASALETTTPSLDQENIGSSAGILRALHKDSQPNSGVDNASNPSDEEEDGFDLVNEDDSDDSIDSLHDRESPRP